MVLLLSLLKRPQRSDQIINAWLFSWIITYIFFCLYVHEYILNWLNFLQVVPFLIILCFSLKWSCLVLCLSKHLRNLCWSISENSLYHDLLEKNLQQHFGYKTWRFHAYRFGKGLVFRNLCIIDIDNTGYSLYIWVIHNIMTYFSCLRDFRYVWFTFIGN